jgi:predicted NAD/FAD-binding protein
MNDIKLPTIKPKTAIIGSGIAGLSAAYFLKDHHDVTIYEKADRLGGHSRTIQIQNGPEQVLVDTGFIVLNDRTYPYLNKFFSELGVAIEPTEMSFSVSSIKSGLEWAGNSLGTLFAQKKNLLNFSMIRGVLDILKFNKKAHHWVVQNPNLTLRELISSLGLGEWFKTNYLLPMGGAIWSNATPIILDFPATAFVDFFSNHGLLSLKDRPQWYTPRLKSLDYIQRLEKIFEEKNIAVIKNARVIVSRRDESVIITLRDSLSPPQVYDNVVFACHPSKIIDVLENPSIEEYLLFAKFATQSNKIYTHKNKNYMPKNPKCWSSWNYLHSDAITLDSVSLTYWMNKLQHIPKDFPVFVTLNPREEIPMEDIFDVHTFEHVVYDYNSNQNILSVQGLQGKNRTWFCGAYLRYGFHEDGIWSAHYMARKMGIKLPW